MELREVIGRRRSIRFLLPYKPVEPEKIQRMLEAARLASQRLEQWSEATFCNGTRMWPFSST